MVVLPRPSISTMIEIIRTAKDSWRSRRAWWFLATTRTRERYARTKLGSLWASLTVLLSIGSLGFVYGKLLKVEDFNAYMIYLGTGLMIWQTISMCISSASNTFKSQALNIQNLDHDLSLYTLTEWAFQVQTFLQSFIVILTSLSFFDKALIPNFLCSGWLPLLNLLLFIYWLPTLTSVLGAKYEDISQLIPIVLQLSFLLSPILYQKEALGSYSWIATYNPLYIILASLRDSLISGSAPISINISILAVNMLGIVASIHLLNKERRNLAIFL